MVDCGSHRNPPPTFRGGAVNASNTKKPITHQGNLAKLPRALAPFIERPQWAVWRWTQKPDGTWQKPPFQALRPDRNASTSDPSTWTDYEAALDAVETKRADGITYMLTQADSLAAIDIDNCRDVSTHSIDVWAQNFLDTGRNSYSEVTPSGAGCRIWGLASGVSVHRKFTLEIDGKPIMAELFRRTAKALTITGLTLDPAIRALANIDKVVDWGLIWGERRKAAAAAAATVTAGNSLNGGGSSYSVDEIERIVCEGAPAGENRSDTFHTIVGHYLGCGWDAEQICVHLQKFPNGIGGRYLSEGRLSGEIVRSVNKYDAGALPLSDTNGWANGFGAKAPAPAPEPPGSDEELGELDDDPGAGDDEPAPPVDIDPGEELEEVLPALDPELDEDLEPSALDPELNDEINDEGSPALDPELEDELNEDETPAPDPNLPPLYAHGDPDPRPLKSWTIKHLIPACGHGLLSGQWGAGKTFVVFDLAAALMTGQPFLGHIVKRQCGVLLIAAEGAEEVRLRLEAVVRVKCGGMQRAPFRWYEDTPTLLQKGSTEKLIAMARQADASLRAEFGLPLGLVVVDTLAACAGYTRASEENDAAAGTAVMNTLKAVARATNCFVLGVAHFGKNLEAGTRGTSSREDASDVVLACLGEKELSGSVVDTRLAVRKHRGGRQGQEYPFILRDVEAPEPDEDGDPVITKVVDWQAPGAAGEARERPKPDPWAEARRRDQKTAVLRLKRVLMSLLADRGVELPIPPDGPTVRMIDQEVVRGEFYSHTPADGTPEQKGNFRRQKFFRALEWAEDQQLIGIEEIDGVTYLRLTRLETKSDDEPGA
jgi:hypothetical protein